MPSSQQFQSFSSTSFSTFTTSSSSSSSSSHHRHGGGSGGGAPVTQTYTERATFNDRDGGRVERTAEATGRPAWHETTRLDPQGRALPSSSSSSTGNHQQQQQQQQRRIEDVTDDDDDDDKNNAARRYEENIQDEYAKREGGA